MDPNPPVTSLTTDHGPPATDDRPPATDDHANAEAGATDDRPPATDQVTTDHGQPTADGRPHESEDADRDVLLRALARAYPHPAERAIAVDRLMRDDPAAPYQAALENLVQPEQIPGGSVPAQRAQEIWRLALELRHGWSSELPPAVAIPAAAEEAITHTLLPEPGTSSRKPSLSQYLDRDLLTGLFHGNHYQAALVAEIERARRLSRPLSLLLIEAGTPTTGHRPPTTDRPPRTPEDRGQQASELKPLSDDMLQLVGDTVRRHFRSDDIPCRVSGNLMAVILPATSRQSAETIARQLIASVHKSAPLSGISLSIGLASYPEAARTPRAFHRAAETALQESQTKGISTLSVFQSPLRVSRPAYVSRRRMSAWPTMAVVLLIGLVGGYELALRHPSDTGATPRDDTGVTATSPSIPVDTPPPTATPTRNATPTAPSAHPKPVKPDRAAGAPAQNPAGGANPVEQVASGRVVGLYEQAGHRLRLRAAGTGDKAARVRALIAAGCAEAAAGQSPLSTWHQAMVNASNAPQSTRPELSSEVELARSRWYLRHSKWSTLAGLKQITNQATDLTVRNNAAVALYQEYVSRRQIGPAATLARWMAGHTQGDASSAFGILEHSALGRSPDVIAAITSHSNALDAGGDLAIATAEEAAQAAIPAWSRRGSGYRDAALLLATQGLSHHTRETLRLALGQRLLEAGDWADAHTVLEPLEAPGQTLTSPSQQQEALTLGGLARWRLGAPGSARSEWGRVEQIKNIHPDIGAPGPDEMFWRVTARALAGLLPPLEYQHFLQLEGAPRLQQGARMMAILRPAARYQPRPGRWRTRPVRRPFAPAGRYPILKVPARRFPVSRFPVPHLAPRPIATRRSQRSRWRPKAVASRPKVTRRRTYPIRRSLSGRRSLPNRRYSLHRPAPKKH